MKDTYTRIAAWAGPLAVALWIGGLFAITHDNPHDHATDAQILAWYQGNANWILLGGWLFMLGCLCFIVFASALRRRLARAEGGEGSLATLAFAGAVLAGGFGLMIPLADIAGAIDKSDITAATAGTFHRIGDAFFVGAALGLVVPFAAVAVLAWRTRVVPRWWAALGGFAALVLIIGPIGWAALIFGTPIWVLGTTFFLLRRPERMNAVPVTT